MELIGDSYSETGKGVEENVIKNKYSKF